LQFYDALVTQPFGLGVFFLTVLFIPLSCYLIYRRVPAESLLYGRWSNPVLYTLVVLYALGWIYKIIVMRLL
jgi:phosphatidate phosphatase APP1